MTIAIKKMLQQTFASDEVIGVVQRDYNTDETEEEFIANGGKAEKFEGISLLPDGTHMAACTNCADYVVKQVGDAYRYGFFVENNPVTNKEIQDVGGHDFAVVQGRYIVDLWVSLFTGIEDKIVYDMRDKADEKIITEIFGDPNKWSLYDHINKISYEADELPAQFKLTLGKQPESPSYSM